MSLLKKKTHSFNTETTDISKKSSRNQLPKIHITNTHDLKSENAHSFGGKISDLGNMSMNSIKFQDSFVTQTSHNLEQEKPAQAQLELFSDNYNPDSQRTISVTPGAKKLNESRILKNLSSHEVVSNFEDFLNTPEAAIAVSKKKPRDVQFYFLINPKSGNGLGQKILEKNPKPFKFVSKFWETLPFCAEIRDLSVNFISMDRIDRMNNVFQQISNISKISLSKEINQYIVVGGGDGSLAPVLSQISEFNPVFSKIVFAMFPLGTFNDMSRCLKSHKLKKYSKEKNFRIKNLHKNIGKICGKLLQGDIKSMDVWKVGVDCRQKGGIKRLKKDTFGVREEYILEYDNEMIKRAELKQKVKQHKEEEKAKKRNKRKGSNHSQDLFMIREDEDIWPEDKNTLENQLEDNIKQLKGNKRVNKDANYKCKAQKLGIHKSNKIRSTNQEFLMTGFMSIGLNA